MKSSDVVRRVLNGLTIGAVVVVTLVLTVYLSYREDQQPFGVVLGVVVGAIVSLVPTWISSREDRKRRTRAASVLFRSEIYAYQDWIYQSLKAARWAPVPTHVATPEHLAALAYAVDWDDWKTLGRSRRYTNQLIGLSKISGPNSESREKARQTFEVINDAVRILTKLDGGRPDAHPNTDDVRRMVADAQVRERRRRTLLACWGRSRRS